MERAQELANIEKSRRFQFLGIPPKGELQGCLDYPPVNLDCFQFLGIPPKGERYVKNCSRLSESVSNF